MKIPATTIPLRLCAICPHDFTPTRPTDKYCSEPCRVEASRRQALARYHAKGQTPEGVAKRKELYRRRAEAEAAQREAEEDAILEAVEDAERERPLSSPAWANDPNRKTLDPRFHFNSTAPRVLRPGERLYVPAVRLQEGQG